MISVATNNAEIGGGEVMLLQVAEAVAASGRRTQIVAPTGSEVAQEAARRQIPVVDLQAETRREWMAALRRWDRGEREGTLWCNGLVPAVATAGHPDRVIHLHRFPSSRGQRVAVKIARARSRAVVVPSSFLARALGAEALPNWSPQVVLAQGSRDHEDLRIGFLGRLTSEKGVCDLAGAVGRLRATGAAVELVVAGTERFSDASSTEPIDSALRELGPACRRLGWSEPAALLGLVDVLACPSVADEAFGLVVTEAMSASVPVVVSDAGALPEVVGPDHPWVARRGDPRDLARVLSEVAAASSDERAAIGEAGRQRWEEHYSPAAGQLRLADFLERNHL
ncbi:glycosyltransferase family 4 protein [Janibacter sp. GXQ6167]|uniref:glycosyltransferase family 4 protein n=1 Tax=Janibacter sp. GXQ6167 TaxID=3240791 RepID=UPI0035233C67